MSELEDLVARFLELREERPELGAREFASEHPSCAAELEAAIEHVLVTVARFALVTPVGTSSAGERRIGEYELLREIGRGGMGVVFEARRAGDPAAERVAVKVLPLAGLLGERALSRFRREARILERLDHRQIVGVREFGVEGDSPFLVMELVEGEALSTRAGARDAREAAALIASLARAVQAAHDSGVLHRDIKPQNVIVTADRGPVLLDFGLVAACDEAAITSTGDLLGTPRYMSPEQARGEAATERSDVYALGLVLYELVAGRPAFEQGERSGLLEAVARSAFTDPRRLRPALPAGLVTVLCCALAWNPRRRFASAEALAEDLERFAGGGAVLARAPGALARSLDLIARRPLPSVIAALALALGFSLVFGVFLPRLAARRAAQSRAVERAFDLAVAARMRGYEERCALALDEALALDPDHAPARALRSVIHERAAEERADGAGALVLEALDLERRAEYERARARLRAAVELEPSSPWAVALLARNARRAGDLDSAEADLVAGSQAAPGSLTIAQELAMLLYDRGEFARAEREYRRGLELRDDVPYLWQGLSLALFRLERDEQALAATQRAMELAGRLDPAMANTMAALLDRMGHKLEAQELLRRLVDEHPESVVYCFNLAYSLDSESLVAEAKPLYERVLELDPGNARATVCLAWLMATADQPELHDEVAGEELLLAALEQDRGRTPELVMGALQFAGETGRVERLAELIGQLAQEGEVDERAVRLSRAARSLEELRERRR